VPLLGEVTGTVVHVNEELVRVDAITANVQSITGNISALASLFAATLGGPVVKVAAFSYGVRRAAGKKDAADIEKRVKAQIKAEKKAAKR
jgi:anthranilate phosphoribosyltransferase